MNIKEDIENKYKQSIKDKNLELAGTLRLIKSAIKDKEILLRSTSKDEISDKDIMALLQSLIKQRRDSIDSFTSANRQDLVDKEKNEINVINSFLPEQKNENETEEIIINIVKKNNFNSLKDMGKLMNLIKSDYSSQIDLGLAGKIAKDKLSS